MWWRSSRQGLPGTDGPGCATSPSPNHSLPAPAKILSPLPPHDPTEGARCAQTSFAGEPVAGSCGPAALRLWRHPGATLEIQLRIGTGALHGALHQLAERLASACERLQQDYRQAPVKHADETGWRTDGCNGYAWLFCSPQTSLFRFRQTRSGQVAQEVLGEQLLTGVLVVDRYPGYNRAPCPLQYCYAHLLREVQDLEKEFPEHVEVLVFVSMFAPLLSAAMKLRRQALEPAEFGTQASQLKDRIADWSENAAHHPGIQRIQNIFREHPARLYHWAENPAVPADNNFAERELRPLVIARKISFGSQSEKGARTREVLMSVLHTLRKRQGDTTAFFERTLNALSGDDALNPYDALFKFDSS